MTFKPEDCEKLLQQSKPSKPTQASQLMSMPFKLMGIGAKYLLEKKLLIKESGAELANEKSVSQYLKSSNTGLLLDGNDKRLSESESYQNVLLSARIGTGKTTRYIVPNVLDKAREKMSIVVNDPKGEVHELTSAYMKQCGYKVIVIDPENLNVSSGFNPLAEAKSDIEIEQVAEILIRSSNVESGDDFWLKGAVRFVSLFIKVLKNAELENPGVYNLHNLFYLFQQFGQSGEKLKAFMADYTVNIHDVKDRSLWHEYEGILSGNAEGINSFVLTAITALKSLSNQNIAKLTAHSDFQLSDIRKEKTIIYFITPPQNARYYSFLTSLFFKSLFNASMRELPKKSTLPLLVLYDEFGHSTLPDFDAIANTIRGYKVSISVILQSITQLTNRYGHEQAESILGGFNTYMTFGSADPSTSEFFTRIIGTTRVIQQQELTRPLYKQMDYKRVVSNEVRQLEENQALLVSKNRSAAIINTTPYFENSTFLRQSKKGKSDQLSKQKLLSQMTLKYVDLS